MTGLGGRNGHPIGSASIMSFHPGHERGTKPLYFGLTEGSPPGLPGGGITGMVPPCGAGACMS